MFRISKLFVFVCLLPSCLSIAYFGFFASDIYVSNSVYITHSSSSSSSAANTSAALFPKLTAGSQSVDYGSIIETYMNSTDALNELNKKINLRKVFTSSEIDPFHRFDFFKFNNSNEKLLLYFRNRIEIKIDSLTSISTFSVNAFRAEDAKFINEELLKLSESFVNTLNEQFRQDAIKNALYEITVAKSNLEKADIALSEFRSQTKPVESKYFIPRFQILTYERANAEKQLGSAIDALEDAKVEAQKKKIYLERVVQPNLPDYPILPKRIFGILTTIAISLITWLIVRLLVAGAKDHFN
jgi:capsular polysaccharide transport system permease protein